MSDTKKGLHSEMKFPNVGSDVGVGCGSGVGNRFGFLAGTTEGMGVGDCVAGMRTTLYFPEQAVLPAQP